MIDVKRLAVDAGYWDEVAGAIGGTHYDKETGFFCDDKGYYSEHGFKPWIMIKPAVRDQPERFIPQPQPEWVDGLPPAGAKCEYAIGSQSFRSCCFVGIKSSGSYVIETVDGEFKSYHPRQIKFRPILTPEQRQREDLEQKITIALRACHAGDSDKDAAQRVVDVILAAGWQKPD